MTHPYFSGTRHPRVFAHRGLAIAVGGDSSILENTAGAFAAAHAAGVEYIETDCRMTADGDVVLFHDDTLARLLDDQRRVDEVRTAELAELLAPHGGLLTAAEMLDMFPETRFNIDVKTDAAAGPLGRAIAPHSHRVLVTSFSDARRIRAVRSAENAGAKQRPAASAGRSTIIRTRLLSAVRTSPARVLRHLDALQIPERSGSVQVLTAPLLQAAHRCGVEVHVWTVNDPDEMTRLAGFGIDGIVTDRADIALGVLG